METDQVSSRQPTTVRYVHIFADAAGDSHFKDLELELLPATTGERSPLLPTKGAIFAHHPGGYESGWHTVSRRQLVVTLSGRAELVASDGERRQIGPGGILLAEDTTGKGHLLRILEERVCVYLPVADSWRLDER